MAGNVYEKAGNIIPSRKPAKTSQAGPRLIRRGRTAHQNRHCNQLDRAQTGWPAGPHEKCAASEVSQLQCAAWAASTQDSAKLVDWAPGRCTRAKWEGALDRARTDDLRLIRATRYQLRYESCARIKSVPGKRAIILKRNVIKVEDPAADFPHPAFLTFKGLKLSTPFTTLGRKAKQSPRLSYFRQKKKPHCCSAAPHPP